MEAPHHVVWAALADLASHADWMRDVRSIEFTSEATSGFGTRMEVETRVGPLRTVDVIEVVGWVEGRSIEVEHRGLITGIGRLSVSAPPTTVTWGETLRFPWWLGGPVTAWLARPVLASIWRGNLMRLERAVNSL